MALEGIGSNWLYEVTIKTDPITNKRKRKKKRGFKTNREVEKALVVLITTVYSGTYFEPSTMLFEEYLHEWFQTKKSQIGKQTAKNYESNIRFHIVPYLGKYPLSKLNTLIIQNLINLLVDKGLSNATIKKIYNILKNTIQKAFIHELISKNIVSMVELPKVVRNELKVWNTEEVKLFLNAAKESRYYIAFHLALTTGVRQGGLLALRWKDVDLERGTIHTRQTLSLDGKEFLSGAKTSSSIRPIRLLSETNNTL